MLYALFNSVKNVFLVLLNVPLALTGGIFALAYFGENLSVPSSVGFIALFGIALTNSVVLVSQFVQLQTEGMGLQESVIRGCRSRLRAVLMTAVTTYAGLLPLVIATGVGSEVQRPLAIVVLGGLVSSTLLTLLAVPTLYVWMSNEEAVDIRVLPYESGLPALAEDA
jgi:cobalt-zinc-cadmium resistance protein CzcA